MAGIDPELVSTRGIQPILVGLDIALPAMVPNLGDSSEATLNERYTEAFMGSISPEDEEQRHVTYGRELGGAAIRMVRTLHIPQDGLQRVDHVLQLTDRRAASSDDTDIHRYEASHFRQVDGGLVRTPSISMFVGREVSLDRVVAQAGLSLAGVKRISPDFKEIRTVGADFHGRNMGAEAKGAFGITIPLLETLESVPLERVG